LSSGAEYRYKPRPKVFDPDADPDLKVQDWDADLLTILFFSYASNSGSEDQPSPICNAFFRKWKTTGTFSKPSGTVIDYFLKLKA
jgi:hypothetical protein